MGIYDREYFREGPSWLAGRDRACKSLLAINIAFFVVQLLTHQPAQRAWHAGGIPWLASDPLTDALLLDANAVCHGQVWRLLTHAFLHSQTDLWHIVFNMFCLWWFGREIEALYGSREFLAFYLLAAIAGGLAFTAGLGYGIEHSAVRPWRFWGTNGSFTGYGSPLSWPHRRGVLLLAHADMVIRRLEHRLGCLLLPN